MMQPDSVKQPPLKINSLVLYKNRPARLARISDRLELELEGGETARVRPKDVDLLHPGPLNHLAELRLGNGSTESDSAAWPEAWQNAWELLAGETTHLAELAELVYGHFTPAAAWAAWKVVAEGLYFEGAPTAIRARTAEEVARRKQEREQAEANQRARAAFFARLRQNKVLPEDHEHLREVENLASGRSERSAVLKELGRAETPDSAHALLVELGVWDEQVNPYPARLGLPLKQPDLPVPELPAEPRRDLTHLPAFAIDDEGTDTPDDAISFESLPGGNGGRLWVHIADVAALVQPDSPLDLEARARGESLHLPEGTVHLLPWAVTARLGLGLNEISPALSFRMDLNDAGEVTAFEILPSRVRVTRLTYESAEQLIESQPLRDLARLTGLVRERRRANGAVMIDFPEVRIKVTAGQVHIHPLPTLRSRAIVEEAMILTGIETARYASQHGLGLPFSQQEPPDPPLSGALAHPQTLSEMFATRRQLRRSRYSTAPAAHSGLGASAYTQVTSPLRRYLDLVGHQQLRAHLQGSPRIDDSAMIERIGATEAVTGNVRLGELLSEKHWTLVYLLHQPGWRGEGILVDLRSQAGRGATGVVLIPALAYEARVHLSGEVPLDGTLSLALSGVNLTQREASFRVENR